jgi:molybdopterin-guanine dinucleotide biosynthesis protein A
MMQPARTQPILGAVLAGGASRRFGSPKAVAQVEGRRIIDRVRDVLAEAADEMVLIANEPSLFAGVGMPLRGDRVAGLGPLAGVESALLWASERGAGGALCVSCDMPFLSAALLRELALRGGEARAVVPESLRGIEPLCAWYPVGAQAAVTRLLASDDRSLRALLGSVETVRMRVDQVRRFGDPEVLFFNVNTPGDLERAGQIARQIDGSH